MKTRLLFLLRLYALLLAVFVLQKPVFMLADAPQGAHYGLADCLQVMANGLLLDVPVTGYLIALPLLFTLVSVWLPWRISLRRLSTVYYVIISTAVALAFVTDTSLYPFWKFKLDATVFYYIDTPKDAFASVSMGYIALRILLIVLYAAVLVWLLPRATPCLLHPVDGWRRKTGLSLLLVSLIGPLAISIRGGLGESTTNVGKVYFSEDEYLNHSAINPLFSMIASLDKAENYADEFNYFDEEERKRLFSGLYPDTEADTTALLNTTRPNIIIIIMEGFGGQFIKAVSGRDDIAPNYNRLATEGVLFTHCYSNSFRTDRGTVSTLSGYPSFPTLSVMKLPAKSRTLPCLASTLNNAGYTSSFLYGGDINFTNMKSYLRTGGYANIVSDVDFPVHQRKDNPWGANDDVTFNRLLSMAKAQKSEPWHIGYLTLSSHEPFVVPYHRLKEKKPNAFAFTDDCLGRFVESIRRTPLWHNLLIVCIPDHGFAYLEHITHEQHHHNTMLWLGGAVAQHRVVSTLMNQSDMAATLLGQLRLSHKEYTFSRDIFSPDYKYPFAFFTFTGGIGLADSTGCTVYDLVGDRITEDRPAVNRADESLTRRRTDRAKAILQRFYDDIGRR